MKLFKSKPKKEQIPMLMHFICARHNQCIKKGPCSNNCLYTKDFGKSRLRWDSIKPAGYIDFILDKNQELWEVNWNWDKNLPVSFRAKPETIISFTYDDIKNLADSGALRRAWINNEPDIEIDFRPSAGNS